MNQKIKIDGLFQRCYELSEHKKVIRNSHLPFRSGFYVTEYDIILKVDIPNIYVLTDKGWENGQSYFCLWYDDMKDFADIPDDIIHELDLENKQHV